MAALSRVISGQTSGKLEKRADRGSERNGNWGMRSVGSGNSRSVAKSGGANLSKKLGTIPWGSKSPGSSHVWQAPNYSGVNVLFGVVKNRQFYDE